MRGQKNSVERMLDRNVEKTPTCWNWTGPARKNGHAITKIGGKTYSAPRVFYEHFIGAITTGHWVVRACKNKLCVNPEHLQAMRPSDGLAESDSTPGKNARKTHCVHGHEFHGANLYVKPSGARVCKACKDISAKTNTAKRRSNRA